MEVKVGFTPGVPLQLHEFSADASHDLDSLILDVELAANFGADWL